MEDRGSGALIRAWASRHRRVAVTVVVAIWILAAILVGLATSGGVVWF